MEETTHQLEELELDLVKTKEILNSKCLYIQKIDSELEGEKHKASTMSETISREREDFRRRELELERKLSEIDRKMKHYSHDYEMQYKQTL